MAQAGGEGQGAGSVTITVQPQAPPTLQAEERITLRLAPRRKKKVSWECGTIDNEFMDKKSSKICCIFHKEDEFCSSSSSSESESDDEDRDQKRSGKGKQKKKQERDRRHHHLQNDEIQHHQQQCGEGCSERS